MLKSGSRSKTTRVKTAKGRKLSSTLWLKRQLNDPYVSQAKADGYRSRAAYKLLEIDAKYRLIKPGMHIVDLGAAPGGWSQVAAKIVYSRKATGKIVAIDLLPIEEIVGVISCQQDFCTSEAPDLIKELLAGPADLVMSDMAANTTGHGPTDHLRIMDLCERAVIFAEQILNPGGHFIAKIFRGGAETQLLNRIKRSFKSVKHFKPKSSRADSTEMYLIATGFQKVSS